MASFPRYLAIHIYSYAAAGVSYHKYSDLRRCNSPVWLAAPLAAATGVMWPGKIASDASAVLMHQRNVHEEQLLLKRVDIAEQCIGNMLKTDHHLGQRIDLLHERIDRAEKRD